MSKEKCQRKTKSSILTGWKRISSPKTMANQTRENRREIPILGKQFCNN